MKMMSEYPLKGKKIGIRENPQRVKMVKQARDGIGKGMS